jgi:predicted acetyltransferase
MEPRRVNLAARDGLWLRIVDVAEALARRGYAADDSVVLDIHDDFMPAAGGRFRLTTSGGRGMAERTSDAADIAMSMADLGALYLGDQTLMTLARAARTSELTAGAWDRADAMLRTNVRPWCPQVF